MAVEQYFTLPHTFQVSGSTSEFELILSTKKNPFLAHSQSFQAHSEHILSKKKWRDVMWHYGHLLLLLFSVVFYYLSTNYIDM